MEFPDGTKTDTGRVVDRRKKDDDLMHQIMQIMTLGFPDNGSDDNPILEAVKRRFNRAQ